MRKLILYLCLVISTKTTAQTEGYACIYSKNLCGGKTASGKSLDCQALTAAHRTYSLGTQLKVTNQTNQKSVVLTITDRGPFTKKFILDLTPAAANAIGLTYRQGKVKVKIEKL